MSSSSIAASEGEEAPSAIRVLRKQRRLILESKSNAAAAAGSVGEESSSSSASAEGTVTIADHQQGGSSFTYDAVFGPESQQIDIFESVKGIVDAVVSGYNGTIVAYGQTSSGKTHTIFGEESALSSSTDNDEATAGLVQRSLKLYLTR
ncbi:kinesin family protein [Skeletonema marinoi]|uniref:Kinesin family protein n=1 Tax=Skeletonema marinoi TaxID=267567 RepID=A0AAD8XZP4_9STRA|nr:kinesin family protein [Skeletonema marinoi]